MRLPIRPAPSSRPLALVPLAVSMAAVVAGCGLFPLSWLNPTSPNRDPSPSPSAAAATPAPAESGTAGTIDDAASGFSVQLPAGWRLLEAGDDGWVSVYGSHDSDPERDVANGTIQDYAVPLPQVEDRALNLAVYVRPVPAGTTLDRLADGYESTLRGSPRFTKIERAGVDLAAGRAAVLSAQRSTTETSRPPYYHLDAYIIVSGNRAYYLVFVSSESTIERYAPIFRATADSIRFATP
jgi:hypothetical protein